MSTFLSTAVILVEKHIKMKLQYVAISHISHFK